MFHCAEVGDQFVAHTRPPVTQEKKNDLPTALDASTFASALGQAVWLMTVSKEHRDLPIRFIEERITPAVLLRQFKIYLKDKQPIAFISWAAVSEEVNARMQAGGFTLTPADWRSGNRVVVVECISPFAPKSEIIAQFRAIGPSEGKLKG